MRVLSRVFAILLAVIAAVLGFVTLVVTGLMVADLAAEKTARILPSYEKEDLTEVLKKEEWTEEDYALLYRQTGLSKTGIDSLKREDIAGYQEALFFRGEVRHDDPAAVTTQYDHLFDPATDAPVTAPIVPLEVGDVLVSNSCHTFGWRNGHAALVVNVYTGSVLESITVGMDSQVDPGGDIWFRQAGAFMVLRLKDTSAEERASIAADALDKLWEIPYSLFVGFFSPKDQCENGKQAQMTHCSHLVWQAYKNAGYDIDSNGGPLVTARDIARSPLFEVVQVYGFDPIQLW